MTFLELVQAFHRECGASGLAPSTVVSQRGEAGRLVAWIKQADIYVQELWENWKFRRSTYNEVTAIGSNDLPVVTDAAWFDPDTFQIKEAGTTEYYPIEVVEYDAIKNEVRDTDNGLPYRVVIMPDGTLEVDPPADGVHTIRGDYYTNPIEMAANIDVSAIPPRYHRVIIGRALILYGNYENASEAKTQGQEIYMEQLARLENNQLPNQHNSRFRTGGHFEVIAGR